MVEIGVRFSFLGIIAAGNGVRELQNPHRTIVRTEFVLLARGGNADGEARLFERRKQLAHAIERASQSQVVATVPLSLRLEQVLPMPHGLIGQEALEHVGAVHP